MSLTVGDKKYIKEAIIDGITEAIQSIIVPQFDQINARLDRIEQRLDKVEQRLDKVEHWLDKVERRLDKVEKRLDRVEDGIRELYSFNDVTAAAIKELFAQNRRAQRTVL